MSRLQARELKFLSAVKVKTMNGRIRNTEIKADLYVEFMRDGWKNVDKMVWTCEKNV